MSPARLGFVAVGVAVAAAAAPISHGRAQSSTIEAAVPRATAPGAPPATPRLPSITPAPPCSDTPAVEGWAHRIHGGRVASRLGAPHHAATDVVVAAGQPAVVAGKFAYGVGSKDVEDEWVALHHEEAPCRWREIARARTDDDGRVRFDVSRAVAIRSGAHAFRLVLVGDGSRAVASVWVVAPATRAVLFDIDGTLTVDDGELFEDLLGGDAPRMHPGADAVARRWAHLGYLPVYVTGRPYFLRPSTARWLVERGFPPGPLVTVDQVLDAWPSHGRIGAWKQATIARLLRTVAIEWAYGNASTDVCAYHRAGIPTDRTYIVGTGAPACGAAPPTRALPSYVVHLPAIGDDLRVASP